MIIKEYYRTRSDGVNLYKSYSDSDFYIKQEETGNIFEVAIDIEGLIYTYTETDQKIHAEVDESEIEIEEEVE